jgi:hypothetical protein
METPLMRQIVAWDGPAPFPGDYLAGRGQDEVWRIVAIVRMAGGGRLSLDLLKASPETVSPRAVVHGWQRMASHDPEGPARVRQVIGAGPTAVMRGAWRDPDDMRPNARAPREIAGYRTYCPLRRMMLNKGSQIDERQVLAADLLRSQVDIAVIGKGARSMEALGRSGFGPVAGPSGSAVQRVWALAQARRALLRLAPPARVLVTEIVLFNRSVQAWCHANDPPRDPKVEMGRLLAALDVLADHYAAEIDEALAKGRMLEVA